MSGFVEITVLIVLAVLLVVAVVVLVMLLRRTGRTPAADSLQLLSRQLGQVTEQTSTAIRDLTTNLNERLNQSQDLSQQSQQLVAQRLEFAGKTIGDLKGQLGQLSQATENIMKVGSDVKSLQDILQSPKLRGSLGEWSLENLLADVLPPQNYKMQHRFKNGAIVDALVILARGSVCIDAKFPLNNFKTMLDAPDDSARSKARRAFLKDVRGHIDDIAARYILPEEGTLDFALMYVPAENVYYETLLPAEELDINAVSREKKVVLVSPNTLYAYLMAIATGLKGLQIEKNAQHIYRYLSQLSTDMSLFTNDFATLGKHLINAGAKHDEARRKLDNFTLRLQQIQSQSLDE